MKILVTGGSGFLGSHIADSLSDGGHQVVLYDMERSPYLRDDQEMIIGDVLDQDKLNSSVQGCDIIYHLAAVADIDEAINEPQQTIQVNVMGTVNILEAARQHDVKRFIYASTIYVYSDHGSFYRTSKRAGELLIEDYWERYSLPFTVLRFGSLYGPRADNRNAIHRIISQAIKEKRISYNGTGKEVREYIHVLDAASAAVKILDAEFENENISLTGRERMTTVDMFEMISEIMGGDLSVEFESKTQIGHYVHTPYNYTPKLGRKLVHDTYIDLGLGLLDCIQSIDRLSNSK